MTGPLRIGALGASRIAPMALIRPARSVDEAEVVAVAARDQGRAAAYARKHRIPRVHATYEALLADADIDAVYVPLPNSLHHAWTMRALEAGKHVLCEKPSAANAREAQEMVDAATSAGRVLVEAFHWRYHAMAERIVELVREGAVGRLVHVDAAFCIPLPIFSDIRYRRDLAGGALMDVGSYTVSMLRHLAGEEPAVVSATCLLRSEGVDRRTDARLKYPSGATASLTASMWSRTLLKASVVLRGEAGEIRALNPIAPQVGWRRLTVRTASGVRVEKVGGEGTYARQLRAFVSRVRGGDPLPTEGDDIVRNMAVIDAIYAAAGVDRSTAVDP